MPLLPKAARAALHFWEEPCISGTRGSGTVFFSGCSLSCVYCQNYGISHKNFGKIITAERLAEIFKELENSGAHNINLVNPTHNTFALKQALDIYKPNIPFVYNSGGYDTTEQLELLKDYIDIYLMDLKYLDSERAYKYSGAADYPEVAKKAIKYCCSLVPDCTFKNGIMQKGVIIRHLILPQGTNEAIRVFNWARENVPNAFFSMMAQYVPCGRAEEFPPLDRRITKREYEMVIGYICESGAENVYIQELESGSKQYIPPFDLEGI